MSAFKDNLLAGKTAFIAGGTSGINLGIAKRYAQLGAKVAVAGRNPEKASNAAAEIGSEALGLSCDVRDYAATRAALEEAAGKFGPLDIVVSGAAGNFVAPALAMSANGFRTVVDIDLNGTFNVFRGCRDLLRTPGAALIAITAGQAVKPAMLQAHVCAAKAGINQLIRVLAMEWGPSGVRVNGISPGPIAGTEGMARLSPTEASTRALAARIPLRRFGEISEVAESAVFLVSDSARYVTGTILDCDGGSQLGDARDPLGEQGLQPG
jgi:NAD(P)-dependent dehydrogenase (short-subunit alcohol dehydrogenase family)